GNDPPRGKPPPDHYAIGRNRVAQRLLGGALRPADGRRILHSGRDCTEYRTGPAGDLDPAGRKENRAETNGKSAGVRFLFARSELYAATESCFRAAAVRAGNQAGSTVRTCLCRRGKHQRTHSRVSRAQSQVDRKGTRYL